MNAIEEVARAVRRESGRRQRIVANLGALGFAMDAGQMSEMSSDALARHALKSLGLTLGNGDPVEALDAYLTGRLHSQQRSAGTRAAAMDEGTSSGVAAIIKKRMEE